MIQFSTLFSLVPPAGTPEPFREQGIRSDSLSPIPGSTKSASVLSHLYIRFCPCFIWSQYDQSYHTCIQTCMHASPLAAGETHSHVPRPPKWGSYASSPKWGSKSRGVNNVFLLLKRWSCMKSLDSDTPQGRVWSLCLRNLVLSYTEVPREFH